MYIKSLLQSNSVCFLVWFCTFHICIILILITSYLNVVSDKTQDVDTICLLTNIHSLSVLFCYTVLSYLLKHAFIIMRRTEVLYIYMYQLPIRKYAGVWWNFIKMTKFQHTPANGIFDDAKILQHYTTFNRNCKQTRPNEKSLVL